MARVTTCYDVSSSPHLTMTPAAYCSPSPLYSSSTMLPKLAFVAMATVVSSAYGLLPLHSSQHARSRRAMVIRPAAAAAAMPAQLSEWGCDDALWAGCPPGAQRDLERYARTGKEDLSRRRMATVLEIRQFTDAPSAAWEKSAWDKAVRAWEADQAMKLAEARAAEKAEKAARMAEAKAKREAREAEEAKAKAEAEAAEAAEAEAATAEAATAQADTKGKAKADDAGGKKQKKVKKEKKEKEAPKASKATKSKGEAAAAPKVAAAPKADNSDGKGVLRDLLLSSTRTP